MKRKLAVLLTAATVFSAILPTTCMAAEKKADIPEGTTISFWHAMGGVNGEAPDYLVNKFNEENEYGIKVDSQYQGEYDDEINKLKSAQLGNMGADLVQIYDIGTRFMIDSGWVIPMQDMIDSEGYDVSDLEPNITAYYTVDDKLYSMPFNSSTPILYYNKDMFEEHGWEVPTTWTEFTNLCDQIQSEGIQPLYFGFKDTWTTLAPWNAIAVSLCDSDLTYQVNSGETTFAENYREVAEKEKALLAYGQKDPVSQGYNDACTAFARGTSAMFTIGSYAISQIKSVNPDMNIGSFVFPANEDADKNVLNSGNDLMFCVMKDCKNKEAAYEVLSYMLEDENVKKYLNAQSAVPCKKGDFEITPELEEMRDYIENGIVADYQDHHYPSEMSVDAMIQTYLMDDSADATDTFMKRFDKEWIRYNRDVVAKVKAYEEGNDHE